MPDYADELHRLTATDAVDLLARGELTPSELVDAAAARIEATDAQINALPTLCLERAREHAVDIERRRRPAGMLSGLPIAVKDLTGVAGVRTTFGSPIYRDHVPPRSDLLVERLERQGAIVIGKSNTPEFGAGASTFNEVFGITRNPWNCEKSVAGSSGGSAASLAAGQVWLATGSDLGGSLRTPASFNGVIGLRPSPGRVPHGPAESPWNNLSVDGPMARTPTDCALMLDALCADGRHPEDPLSQPPPEHSFRAAVAAAEAPQKIAFSPDLGLGPVGEEVVSICRAAAERFREFGAVVDETCPDLSLAPDTFQTLRAAMFATAHQTHLRRHREQLKPEIVWNIEKGLALTAAEIGRAEHDRGRLFHEIAGFFRDYQLLLCPTAIVPPFDAEKRYVETLGEHRFDNYVDWLRLAFPATLCGCPALSVPAGLTATGLPVGLQVIAPPFAEARALTAAALLDRLTGFSARVPLDPRLGGRGERLA